MKTFPCRACGSTVRKQQFRRLSKPCGSKISAKSPLHSLAARLPGQTQRGGREGGAGLRASEGAEDLSGRAPAASPASRRPPRPRSPAAPRFPLPDTFHSQSPGAAPLRLELRAGTRALGLRRESSETERCPHRGARGGAGGAWSRRAGGLAGGTRGPGHTPERATRFGGRSFWEPAGGRRRAGCRVPPDPRAPNRSRGTLGAKARPEPETGSPGTPPKQPGPGAPRPPQPRPPPARAPCAPRPGRTRRAERAARGAPRVSPPPPPARARQWGRRRSDGGAGQTAAALPPSLPEREARGGRPARRPARARGRPGVSRLPGPRGRAGGKEGAPACAHNEAAETRTFPAGAAARASAARRGGAGARGRGGAASGRARTESEHRELSNRGQGAGGRRAAAEGCSLPGPRARAYLRSPGRGCPPG